MAFPDNIAAVATAIGGINGEINFTKGWKYLTRNAPANTGRSTTCSERMEKQFIYGQRKEYQRSITTILYLCMRGMSSFGVALFSLNFTVHLNYLIYNYHFLLNQITEYCQKIA